MEKDKFLFFESNTEALPYPLLVKALYRLSCDLLSSSPLLSGHGFGCSI